MSISLFSAVINLGPPPPMASPSSRFFHLPLAAKPHLLRLCSANCSHTSLSEKTDFSLWKLKMKAILTQQGLIDALKPPPPVKTEIIKDPSAAGPPRVQVDDERTESSDFDSSSLENPGSNEKIEKSQAVSPNEVLSKLKRYGTAGVLSYGLLNTVYYLTTFLVVWLYVSPAPGRMGYLAAAERFLKVMAMVWAGSQVTKLIRAGGALALAPFVDRGLSWFTVKFGFESQGKAFMTIAGFCFGLAFMMFVIVTLLWA